ncbi:helix-turn-helix domain-containing protein [Microbacterium halimionae]|uniref:helix-turn-helix domain-containing protein n=1 Tax=Microbacterium halimionae TaxID=1526413 RepID=UPI003C7B988C
MQGEEWEDESTRALALKLIVAGHAERNFCPQSLAHRLYISRRHLYRCLHSVGGVAEIIGVARAETAAMLMVHNPAATMTDIYPAAGFGNDEALRYHFVRTFGLLPGRYEVGASSHRPVISQALAQTRAATGSAHRHHVAPAPGFHVQQ